MRSFYKAILLIHVITFLGNTLHLHDVSSSYIAYLQNQQNMIKEKLDSLKQQLSQNYKVVQKQNDIDKKISLFENYLKQERLFLAQINLNTVDQQLNASEWVCSAFSEQKKKSINDDIAGINQNLKDMVEIIDSLTDNETGSGIYTAKQELKDTKKTVSIMKNAFVSTGVQVDLSEIHSDRKSNLNSLNWVLDGKKIGELNDEYKKAAESGGLQICNIEEPFFSTQQTKCISCNGQNQFFSLRTQECLKCNIFSLNEHICKDNQGATTNYLPSTQNRIIIPQGKTLDNYKQKSINVVPCPQNAPFYTGQECIQCETFFDIESKTCKKCEGKNHYDSKTHSCNLQEVTITNVEVGKNSLIIPNDKSLNDINNENKKLSSESTIVVCPINKPYYNGFECISCAQGSLFSLIKKSCGTCEAGTFFNKNTNHCEKKTFLSNLKDPNWSSTKNYQQIQKQIQTKLKNPLYMECPIEKPFSIEKECIQCINDEHFDLDKQQCVKCFNGQFFNRNLHNCTSNQNNFQTNPQKASNLIFQGRPKNEWMYIYYQNLEKNDGLTDCPQQRPYFDGISCIICPEQLPLFNLEYKMCQKCSQGTKYDKNHHQCLTTQGNIATQVPTLEKMAAGIFS